MERVEQDGEGVVLAHLVRVAADFIRDPLRLRHRFVQLGRDVEVLVVEHDPGLGPLRDGLPVTRHGLDEAVNRLVLAVDRFVELAVDPQRFAEPDGAHHHLAPFTDDRLRRDRPRQFALRGTCHHRSTRLRERLTCHTHHGGHHGRPHHPTLHHSYFPMRSMFNRTKARRPRLSPDDTSGASRPSRPSWASWASCCPVLRTAGACSLSRRRRDSSGPDSRAWSCRARRCRPRTVHFPADIPNGSGRCC